MGSGLGIAVLLAASAPEHTPEVRWLAPDGCPRRAAVLDDVERYLGRPLERSAESPVVATARVHEVPDGFVLTLLLTTQAGRSEATARNAACGVLARLAALKIAIAVDPMAGQRGAAPVRARSLEPVTPRPPTPPPERAQPRTPRARSRPAKAEVAPSAEASPRARPALSARFDVSGHWGLLPRPAAGLGATLGLRVRRFSLHAGFDRWLALPVEIHPPHPGVAVVRATTGRARGCWAAVAAARVELPLCAGIEGGMLTAEARDLQRSRRTRQPWAALSWGLHLAWVPTPRVAWWVGAPVVVPLLRPGLRTDDGGQFFRAAPLGLRPTTSIEIRFR